MADVTLTDISDKLETVAQDLSDRRESERTQQQAFDSLYEELRQYKDDFIFQAEKPLLLDLLLFYDSLNWFQEQLLKQQVAQDVIADSFQYLIDEFLEVLYRRDVVPMEGRETFDRKSQKAVKVLASDETGQDQRIAQVLKRGFVRGERILRSEEVVIYRDGVGEPGAR